MLTDEDITFLTKDIKTNYDKYDPKESISTIYSINNYIFENDLKLLLKIIRLEKRIKIIVSIVSYNNPDYDDDNYEEWHDTILLIKDYVIGNKTPEVVIKEIVLFILSFRKEYRYSKILDKIDENSLIINNERRDIILNKLCKETDFDSCCICYEANTVLTSCNHNICRKCHSNIKCVYNDEMEMDVKPCPMCRQEI